MYHHPLGRKIGEFGYNTLEMFTHFYYLIGHLNEAKDMDVYWLDKKHNKSFHLLSQPTQYSNQKYNTTNHAKGISSKASIIRQYII